MHDLSGEKQGAGGTPAQARPMLSICVATFNRRELLRRLLSSGDAALDKRLVEWVIVDDGSTDNTSALIDQWRDVATIHYAMQPNAGRARALERAVSMATGRYTVIMDSDDYFVEGGVKAILHGTEQLDSGADTGARPLVGALFGTVIVPGQGRAGNANLPVASARTNFVAARADYRCKGDLKEVVATPVLQEAFAETECDFRRVPTYLLWAKVSLRGDCLMIRQAVAVKEYMPDGMTANIFRLKTTNPLPMARLYGLLSCAALYRSAAYRMQAKVLWYRYALLAGTSSDLPLTDRILYWPAWLIYLSDRLRLAGARFRGAAS